MNILPFCNAALVWFGLLLDTPLTYPESAAEPVRLARNHPSELEDAAPLLAVALSFISGLNLAAVFHGRMIVALLFPKEVELPSSPPPFTACEFVLLHAEACAAFCA